VSALPVTRDGTARRVRVVLADDSYLVREAITAMLEDESWLDLVQECEDRESLELAIEAERPDVVITDIRMPPGFDDEGIRVAAALRSSHPEIGVVVLSQYAEPRYALDLLSEGSDARAYLLKERVHARSDIVAAIRAVARGESVIDPRIVELLVTARLHDNHSRLAELSPRELEILAEIATGKGNGAIAQRLSVSKRSVEKHIHAIFGKLTLGETDDVSRRVKATLIFLSDESRPRPRG
jgi:DNA-binding NarL/FixJ family response regulator